MFQWILRPPPPSPPHVRRPKRQALSSVCNVAQAMTNVNLCKEMFHPYVSVYYQVYLCNNVWNDT